MSYNKFEFITNPSQGSRVPLKKLIVTYLVIKFPAFEPENPLPCSEHPVIYTIEAEMDLIYVLRAHFLQTHVSIIPPPMPRSFWRLLSLFSTKHVGL